MRSLRRAALLVLPLLAAGCGGPLLSAQLEIPELGLKVPQQTFPPSSAADPALWCSAIQDPLQPCIQTELKYDIGSEVDLINQKGVSYQLRLTDLAMVLDASGVGDLHGVRSVQLEAVPPGGGTPVTIASYVRSASNPNPTTIAVSGNTSVDLAPFIESGVVDLRIKMSYDADTPQFTADVNAVFYLHVTLDYLRAAGI